MKTGTIAAVIAALLALALALGGCGGGDDTTALTRAEYLKQADAICKEGLDERTVLFKKANVNIDPNKELSDSAKEKLVLAVILEPYEKSTDQLKELSAPDGEEEKVEALIKAREKSAEEVSEKPLVAVTSIEQFENSNKLSMQYGLKECDV